VNIILDLADKLQRIAESQQQFAGEIINDNEDRIAGLVEGQMNVGQTGEGTPIRPAYSPSYAAFKGFQTPDLKLSGDFHKSIYATAERFGAGIGATDEKTESLVERYGEEILKLSDENADFFNKDILLPELRERNLRELSR
jgi:hypothetical protein